jgi:hypothetical protein
MRLPATKADLEEMAKNVIFIQISKTCIKCKKASCV